MIWPDIPTSLWARVTTERLFRHAWHTSHADQFVWYTNLSHPLCDRPLDRGLVAGDEVEHLRIGNTWSSHPR